VPEPGSVKTPARPKLLQVLAVPFGSGAGVPGTALAPAHLAGSGLLKRLRGYTGVVQRSVSPREDCFRSTSSEGCFRRVLSVASETASHVERAIAAGDRFLVLGGDHSIA